MGIIIDSTGSNPPPVNKLDPTLKAIYQGRVEGAKSEAELDAIRQELHDAGFAIPASQAEANQQEALKALSSTTGSNNPIQGTVGPLPDPNVAAIASTSSDLSLPSALGGKASVNATVLDSTGLAQGGNPELHVPGKQSDPTGLVKGGNPELNVGQALPQAPASTSLAPPADLRVRLAALNPEAVYGGPNGSGILGILASTGGMLFPYTPQISFSQSVSYADLSLVHSNTDYPAYTRTPSISIAVSGKFTVQNQREGQYALAAIHFLRTVSKSYFGDADAKAGTAGLPPPVLLFSGYGPYMFSNVRVILKSHSWVYDENMDTVSVLILGKTVRLPALFTMQCELQVVQTPQRMRTKFSFDAFAKGDLLADGFL